MKLEQFKETLEDDWEKMENIVLPMTAKPMRQLMQSYMEKNLRHYIKKRYQSFIDSAPKKEVNYWFLSIFIRLLYAKKAKCNYYDILKN